MYVLDFFSHICANYNLEGSSRYKVLTICLLFKITKGLHVQGESLHKKKFSHAGEGNSKYT